MRITGDDDTGVPDARHRFRDDSPYAHRNMRFARTCLVVAAAVTMLAGCFTGKRAHFAEAAPQVDDPAVAAVINLLEQPTAAPYTASYTLLTRYGNITTPGTVSQSDDRSRSVTIGNVRFLELPNGDQTCNLTTGVCVPSVDEAQVSNLSLTHNFGKVSP